MERFNMRAQDVVAKLSHVNLQSTVSVLKALYAVASAFESESEYGDLKQSLESVLLSSALDSTGVIQGLRVRPSDAEVNACYWAFDAVEERVPELFAGVRNYGIDRVLFSSIEKRYSQN